MMKKILVLVAALATGISAYAFTPNMSPSQISAEVQQRVVNGETNEVIAAAAAEQGVPAAAIQTSLIVAGRDPVGVFNAMVAANYSPTALLPPTASGAGLPGGLAPFLAFNPTQFRPNPAAPSGNPFLTRPGALPGALTGAPQAEFGLFSFVPSQISPF
jgi:hypothetical protein